MKRKFLKWIISIVASVMLLVPGTALAAPETGWMVATQADGYVAVNEIVTATESVVIHQEPSDNSPILGELQQGQQVTRIGISTTSGWNRIDFNGQVAYVWGEYVKTEAELNQSSNTGLPGVTETPDDMYVQAVQNNIIRSIPDTSGEILGYFNIGDVAHRIAVCSNTWSKIEFNGIVGYIGGQIIGTSAPEQNPIPETPAPETPAPETPAPEIPSTESVEPSETEPLEESTEATIPEETSTEETNTEEGTESEIIESTEKGTEENTAEQNTESLENSSTDEATSAGEENTKKNEASQVSIWKIIFFVFIILLVVNTIILIATLLKKDSSDDLDDVDDDEDDDEPDGNNK